MILSLYLITTTEHGFLDLQRLKKEKESLIIKNSIIGLEILGQLKIFNRLAENDLKLIEHIARTELRMVEENELILIPEEPQQISTENENSEKPGNFRILTEKELKKLLDFDIDSFKFHDKLKDGPESAGEQEGSLLPNR